LRDRLRRRPGSEAAIEAAAGTPAAPAPVDASIYHMPLGRLLLSGAFNFSLLFLAVIFAILQNLQQFGLFKVRDWVTPERADAAAAQVTLSASLVLIGLLLLAGLVSGIARTVALDFGF